MSRRRRIPPSTEAGPSKRRRGNGGDSQSETDELEMSQAPDFSYQEVKEAEVGIVEKVSLKNFMCHNRLDIGFGPHVNFVIGRNGSGKSAIVTALVVGLGGKAAITNRGSTIKGFIKTGKQSAEVEIRLRNRGTDAYRPEDYGDAIIVERRFTADGSSTYKLKSKTGKLISTKRDELNHILDQFNIQVDNPVAILNQDTSRSFLHSKNATDKYKFFLKATQLEQMKSDYAVANEQRQYTTEIIQKKEQTLPTLQMEVIDWEQKFKALACIDDLKKKLKRLKHEMAWALVQEKERGLEPHSKELRQEESRLPKFVAKVTDAEEKLNSYLQRQTAVQEELKKLGEEVNALQPNLEKAQKLVKEKKDEHRKAQMDFRRVEGELRNIKKDRDQTLERIEEIRNTAQYDYESERRAREESIRSLQEKVETLEAQRETTEHQLGQFRAAVAQYKQQGYQISGEERSIQQSIGEKTRYKQTLEGARTDQLKRFGSWVPAAVRQIEEADKQGRFRHRPRGPVGSCFKLKEPSWALSMESCLKALIHSYCCDNHADERVLEQIFQRVCPEGRRPSIIVRKFKNQVHNVTKYKAVSNQYRTALDLIECDDPVILNCLIDQRGLESILLIKDNDEARRVMQRTPPRNTNEVFTASGDQVYARPTFRYYSCEKKTAQFLTANVEENIAACVAEIEALTTELQGVRAQAREVNAAAQDNQRQERSTSTQLMKIRDALHKLQSEINELKSIEDPVPVDVATLEEEVESYNRNVEKLQEKCEPKRTVVQTVKAEVQQADLELKKLEQQIRELKEKADPILNESNTISGDVAKARHHKTHFSQKLKEQEKKIQDIKKTIERYEKELASDVAKAEQICADRVQTRRKAQDLDSEITQIHQRIKAEEKTRGNQEEITRKYYDTQNAFGKIKREIQQLRNFIKRLQEVMIHRQKQFFELRRMIAMRTKYFFIVMLSNRQYTGKISFNHTKETLEMSVQPNNSQTESPPGQGSRDMRALSGGERSFATVCFILALWDAMESPFRCLDEFDVFMDMVNRRISMDMMMEVAGAQTGRQFIFLTPQDMSQLHSTNNLRIYRMPDPDRSQGVLPFEREPRDEEEEDD